MPMQETLPNIVQVEDAWNKYKPISKNLTKKKNVSINLWDVPFTIPQLAYLTHSHFRYYGKFPSVIAGKIIDDHYDPKTKRPIYDNFCGSGTTLVEAKIRGIEAYGSDISWLSIMASNVKTTFVDLNKVLKLLEKVIEDAKNLSINVVLDDRSSKWFSLKEYKDLSCLKAVLLGSKKTDEINFLICAYIAIIRRISKAHDGEVRPHVNKNKKQREVFSTYEKKVKDMIKNHNNFQIVAKKDSIANSFFADATKANDLYKHKSPSLIISHPPYLNAFNYAPVFMLEYLIASEFENYFVDGKSLYKEEIKAHPANENITDKYFKLLKESYKRCNIIQKKGDKLAIVIGDCTRYGEVVKVIDRLILDIEMIGYKLIEINYRTTHYGTGKYAYADRADYHSQKDQKKDGILVFTKLEDFDQ